MSKNDKIFFKITDNMYCVKGHLRYWDKNKKKHQYIHKVLALEKYGLKRIPKGYVIHHWNNDKWDNTKRNLILMTIQAHISLHKNNF